MCSCLLPICRPVPSFYVMAFIPRCTLTVCCSTIVANTNMLKPNMCIYQNKHRELQTVHGNIWYWYGFAFLELLQCTTPMANAQTNTHTHAHTHMHTIVLHHCQRIDCAPIAHETTRPVALLAAGTPASLPQSHGCFK